MEDYGVRRRIDWRPWPTEIQDSLIHEWRHSQPEMHRPNETDLLIQQLETENSSSSTLDKIGSRGTGHHGLFVCVRVLTASFVIVIVCSATRFVYRHFVPSNMYSNHVVAQDFSRGSYVLVECQEGGNFFDFYNFRDGADSVGSAGYNTYVSKERAEELGIISVVNDNDASYVYISSSSTTSGYRESVRLEGKRRFDHGLFILNVTHMPTGCGVWPAFWLTDEENWPNHGEIDILEGINTQTVAKTALHTGALCSMYAQVPPKAWTGKWDRATGVFDRFTGKPDFNTSVPADDCWVEAPHQWGNQGCVAVHSDAESLGSPLNANGGALFVLDLDPANGYIKSWVIRPKIEGIPTNLYDSIRTASQSEDQRVSPDPASWSILPYAYFAIGNGTKCTADHFQNMRLIFNMAFCGNVAGNRFQKDCPSIQTRGSFENPVEQCNDYVASNPGAFAEAFWAIGGVYVFERS